MKQNILDKLWMIKSLWCNMKSPIHYYRDLKKKSCSKSFTFASYKYFHYQEFFLITLNIIPFHECKIISQFIYKVFIAYFLKLTISYASRCQSLAFFKFMEMLKNGNGKWIQVILMVSKMKFLILKWADSPVFNIYSSLNFVFFWGISIKKSFHF